MGLELWAHSKNPPAVMMGKGKEIGDHIVMQKIVLALRKFQLKIISSPPYSKI